MIIKNGVLENDQMFEDEMCPESFREIEWTGSMILINITSLRFEKIHFNCTVCSYDSDYGQCIEILDDTK